MSVRHSVLRRRVTCTRARVGAVRQRVGRLVTTSDGVYQGCGLLADVGNMKPVATVIVLYSALGFAGVASRHGFTYCYKLTPFRRDSNADIHKKYRASDVTGQSVGMRLGHDTLVTVEYSPRLGTCCRHGITRNGRGFDILGTIETGVTTEYFTIMEHKAPCMTLRVWSNVRVYRSVEF